MWVSAHVGMEAAAGEGAVGTSRSARALMSYSDESYRLRPYSATRDHNALSSICADVYGGYDYLPRVAEILASDPKSSFLILADATTERPVAVANARRFHRRMSWLEAVRTCREHRGRGLAQRLTQSLVDLSREQHHELLSCTVESNCAMQSVFAKVGMRRVGRIHQCSFGKLREIPGWAAEGDGEVVAAQSLLKSIGAESLVHDAARTMEWQPVDSEDKLDNVLKVIQDQGGIGHLVGLYELLSDDSIHHCLESGRVWKLAIDDDRDGTGAGAAVMAMTREEKISSLRSPWVCSISATTAKALEAAIWHACSDQCLSLLDGHVAFAVAFDGAVPIEEGSLAQALPLADDACLLFSSAPALLHALAS